ncbi:MAG: hypothetical protein ACYC5O_18025 [Anaerolineae bacterium]
MKGAARPLALAVSVCAVLILLACAVGPQKRSTSDAEATAERHRIIGAQETATARAHGQGGTIGAATPTPNRGATMTAVAGKRAIASSTPTPKPTPTAVGEGWRDVLPAGEDLLPSRPLAEGIADWDLWLQPGGSVPGNNRAEMVTDSQYGPVVQFSRACNCADGGAAGLMQATEIGVAGQEHLYVWLVLKVDAERGGNIANTDPRWFPEGAVQVRLQYTSADGEQAEWYHGFYISDLAGADGEHFSDVSRGRWITNLSDDLAGLSPRPATIDEVRVYGFGWEFSGAVAEFALIGSPEVAP